MSNALLLLEIACYRVIFSDGIECVCVGRGSDKMRDMCQRVALIGYILGLMKRCVRICESNEIQMSVMGLEGSSVE